MRKAWIVMMQLDICVLLREEIMLDLLRLKLKYVRIQIEAKTLVINLEKSLAQV